LWGKNNGGLLVQAEGGLPTTALMAAFTTREAQRLSGLSPRRLQYWDETGFIRPSIAARKGRGSPRLYGFQDLVQLRVAAQLRDNLSLQALRRLKTALDVDAPFAVVSFGITAGNEVVYLGPAGQHEAAKAPGQITMTFNVPLQEIRSDLNERIDKLRRRRGVGTIESSKGILSGRARIKGTRIGAAAVARLVAAGWSTERILGEYPDLRPADIAAAIKAHAKAG
jgi:uncharacterized protein (DUF433 family)